MTKNYGLTGQTVTVKRKSGESAEYPSFLVGTVLPHRHPEGFKESYPYTTTINKHDIQIGEMIVNGGAIR